MATGKSKVGKILAAKMARDFVDTDNLIEEATGKSIPEIFEQDGEAIFRKVEHACVTRASEMPNVVIALGGGAITQEANWKVIQSSGVCLCLLASAQIIFDRVSRKGERPLLAGLDDAGRLAKIQEMMAERDPFYSRADLSVESTDEQSAEETAEIAHQKLKKILVA